VFGNGSTDLPQFVPRTSTAGLIFDYGRFEGRFTWRDRSTYLIVFSTNPLSKQYYGDYPEEDIALTYAINRHYKLFVDAENIRNQNSTSYVVDVHQRPVAVNSIDGGTINIGITGEF